jgi:Holliday junction DNA helicase RuvA
MIISLKGTLAHLGHDYAILDVHGVGYQVFLSARQLRDLPPEGQTVTLYTYLAHREDAMLLYGFPSLEERELFLMLTSVSGVGTKTALGILSAMSASDVVTAIATADSKRLAKAPGIGKKTAERLILELKEKLTAKRTAFREGLGTLALPSSGLSTELQEAELALLSLGYDPDEIVTALTRIPPGASIEDAIRAAIERLSDL